MRRSPPTRPCTGESNAAAEADPALPAGVEPLVAHVEGPPELTRRLRQIGVVAAADGARLQRTLRPGQRLVSREGDLWRWDGFVAAAQVSTAAATRLAERSRLGALARAGGRGAPRRRGRAAAAEAAAQRLARGPGRGEAAAPALARGADQAGPDPRGAHRHGAPGARDGSQDRRRRRRQGPRPGGARRGARPARGDRGGLAALGGTEALEADLAAAQTAAVDLRSRVTESRTELITLEREHRARTERQAAIGLERERWQTRSAGADQQIATLKERTAEAEAEIAKLAALPAMIEQQRQTLMSELATAEQNRQAAADALAAADTAHRQAAQDLRAAQAAVADEREARARIEARLENARAPARRGDAPHPRSAGLRAGGLPGARRAGRGIASCRALDEADSQLTRLKADRERLGGVNLQADEDLTGLTQQFESMDKEKTDVEAAIAKLRSGIAQINNEGRSRLQAAFDTVNGHFQALFATLFGGGEARLEMIEAEDPLEGGLEIVAKPPGKKPATLSLLSGGEQSLTALALIFAVFLTNPSPICVLDEVDAPLDDANVDRFCTLMEKMAADTATRFLVITHHPMTMARMNRLFGVTMAEKGVSQLVSVDLETAQKFTVAA